LTVRNGRVVYDLNGITREPWDKAGATGGDPRWDGFASPRRRGARK
jgi:hypothetical protein